MKCPCCKTELVQYKELHLEFLDHHVFRPNDLPPLSWAYRCPATNCFTNTKDFVPLVYWNTDGDIYYNYPKDKVICDEYSNLRKIIPFVDKNEGAFGSIARQLNVEIYKKDENKLLHTFTFGPWKGWKVYSDWAYKSNEDGDILKKTFHLKWVSPKGYIVGGPPPFGGLSMLKFSLRDVYRNWKLYFYKNGGNFAKKELESNLNRKDWPNAEYWRKIPAFFAKIALWDIKWTEKIKDFFLIFLYELTSFFCLMAMSVSMEDESDY